MSDSASLIVFRLALDHFEADVSVLETQLDKVQIPLFMLFNAAASLFLSDDK